MTAPNLGAALLTALDDETIARLAERLRPYLLDARREDARLLTATQAAARLGLHPKTVARMARDGRLPAVKVGTGWRFHPDRLAFEPAERRQGARAGRSRPGAHRAGVPASVRAIRGENAASGRGTR
jgi:excisionase family DNA binding protein